MTLLLLIVLTDIKRSK